MHSRHISKYGTKCEWNKILRSEINEIPKFYFGYQVYWAGSPRGTYKLNLRIISIIILSKCVLPISVIIC